MNDLPSGYGTNQSQNEIAIEIERFTKMNNADEIKWATQKEMDAKIFARKVISKIIYISQRIIETNQVTRTLDKINEKIKKQQQQDELKRGDCENWKVGVHGFWYLIE